MRCYQCYSLFLSSYPKESSHRISSPWVECQMLVLPQTDQHTGTVLYLQDIQVDNHIYTCTWTLAVVVNNSINTHTHTCRHIRAAAHTSVHVHMHTHTKTHIHKCFSICLLIKNLKQNKAQSAHVESTHKGVN